MAWFFGFFLVSGFCSVLCELIWLRLSMAQFGVTTALTSIVLSVFMAGLGVGSWLAGALVRRYGDRIQFSPLRIYAALELLIGLSALVVPAELVWGHRVLEGLANQAAVSSATYYLISGLWLAATMIPFCACMGATIPVAMFAIRNRMRASDQRSFSFLYLANVLGAVLGSCLPLVLIEPFGFSKTLLIGAALNVAIALSALVLSLTSGPVQPKDSGVSAAVAAGDSHRGLLVLLFATGLATMAMELVWIRIFTPFIGPMVYSFGLILMAYLLATTMGSRIYRKWSGRQTRENRLAWISLTLLTVLPLLAADARIPLPPALRVFLGVTLFSGMIGFLTPMLVDRWSGGDPDRAGRAYAVNVLGCILGPLLCGFVLLPLLGEHGTAGLLALPWLAMAFSGGLPAMRPWSRASAYAVPLVALAIWATTSDFENQFAVRRVLRDSTATVVAQGEGETRRLLVNGVGMTKLTPITKMMAHFTLASLDHEPQRALIICFGMGTTFRSVISWNIPVTAVELVPSVPRMFGYYHADAAQVMTSPFAHVVIDDGRRYLERSATKYDAIIVDPPPPVRTAGSSLLYSEDFYTVARQRLEPGGILQQWLPDGDDATQASMARALQNSFPYVRVFHGLEGWGWHFLASDRPIPERTAAELAARMSPGAIRDMMEWGPAASPEQQMGLLVSHPATLESMIALSPATVALSDDRPINEYFLLRSRFGGWLRWLAVK